MPCVCRLQSKSVQRGLPASAGCCPSGTISGHILQLQHNAAVQSTRKPSSSCTSSNYPTAVHSQCPNSTHSPTGPERYCFTCSWIKHHAIIGHCTEGQRAASKKCGLGGEHTPQPSLSHMFKMSSSNSKSTSKAGSLTNMCAAVQAEHVCSKISQKQHKIQKPVQQF